MILNKTFQNSFWFRKDALCLIESIIASFYDIVHLWTINWVLYLDIHIQIRVPPYIDLIC